VPIPRPVSAVCFQSHASASRRDDCRSFFSCSLVKIASLSSLRPYFSSSFNIVLMSHSSVVMNDLITELDCLPLLSSTRCLDEADPPLYCSVSSFLASLIQLWFFLLSASQSASKQMLNDDNKELYPRPHQASTLLPKPEASPCATVPTGAARSTRNQTWSNLTTYWHALDIAVVPKTLENTQRERYWKESNLVHSAFPEGRASGHWRRLWAYKDGLVWSISMSPLT